MNVKFATYESITSMNRPSIYADPLAWAVVDFSASLLNKVPEESLENVGIIVVSDYCSLATMRALSATSKDGKISPLKFAGANPGVVTGLTAIQYKLRGPSVTLTMNPANASKAVTSVARYWFKHSGVHSVLVITHKKSTDLTDFDKLGGTLISDEKALDAGVISTVCQSGGDAQ